MPKFITLLSFDIDLIKNNKKKQIRIPIEPQPEKGQIWNGILFRGYNKDDLVVNGPFALYGIFEIQDEKGSVQDFTLMVTKRSAQRVQNITSQQAILEGMPISWGARNEYIKYWDANHQDYPWKNNPFVWVIDFQVKLKEKEAEVENKSKIEAKEELESNSIEVEPKESEVQIKKGKRSREKKLDNNE